MAFLPEGQRSAEAAIIRRERQAALPLDRKGLVDRDGLIGVERERIRICPGERCG